jgi:hypothetical protein
MFKNLLAITLAVFAPAKAALFTVGLLVFLDFILGILAARKQSIPITSAGMGRTVVKSLVYELAILLAFLVQTYLTGATMPVMSIVSGFIGVTELTSVLENLEIISGQPLLKIIVAALSSKNNTPPKY